MGIRWYIPLPGPFHISGGWITGLIMAMLWMCWVMIVVVVQMLVLLGVALVVGIDAGQKAWKRHRAAREVQAR